MTIPCRVTHSLLVLILAAGLVGSVAPASALAQEASASLTLLAQTPWNSPDDPRLSITVLATNNGSTVFEDLEVLLTIGPNYASRLQYEASLIDGPAYSVHDEAFPFRGRLEPGESRTFAIDLKMSETPGISQTESLAYPSRVSLLAEGSAVGSFTTPLLYFFQPPEAPLLFSTWVELDAPVVFDPDGRLMDPGFEASLAPGGSLASAMSALLSLESRRGSPVPIDLAIEPSLVEQARRMAAGYSRSDGTTVPAEEGGAATAEDFLAALGNLAASGGVQTLSMPFSGPSIPALLASGLYAEASRQSEFGRRVLAEALDVTPSASVVRPPGGRLSSAALSWLAGSGADIVLANADAVPRPEQEGGYAPPPTATVPTASGPTTLVLPDPGVQGLISRPELLADPVRGAQAILGELAVIWKEEPVPQAPEVRGLALALDSRLPPGVWEPLLGRLADAPFLRMVHAQDLAAGVNPPGAETGLTASGPTVFSPDYVARLRTLHADLDAYASMLTRDDGVSEGLRVNLMYAQAGEFVLDQAGGERWLDSVSSTIHTAFSGTTPRFEQIFTLTSQEGSIPLRLGDPGPIPLRVTVQLSSTQFGFPEGDSQEVELERPDQIVTFQVSAKAAGRNPIRITVLSPSGRAISQQTLVVQTTALNSIALLVTGAAALVLLLLYSRRWFRRRTST